MKMDEKEVVLVSIILEDCLEKLEIMNLLAPPLEQNSHVFLDDESEGVPSVLNERHKLFPDGLHNPVFIADENSLKWESFHSGRIYLENVLKSILNELKINKCCKSLTSVIEREKLGKLEEVQTELKQDMREEKLRHLKRELKKVKINRVQDVKQAEETLIYLKKIIQKTKISNCVSENYCRKQEEIRIEQTKKKLEKQLNDTKDNTEKLKLKIEDERRIHTEVESFRNHDYQCKEIELQAWIDKYNKETSDMDRKIADLLAEKEKQLFIYNALVKQCNEYKQVLKDDEDAKRSERERIELEEKIKKSALIIQCWWRAVMVRRFLGEFRSLKKAMHQRKLKAKALAKAASKKAKK